MESEIKTERYEDNINTHVENSESLVRPIIRHLKTISKNSKQVKLIYRQDDKQGKKNGSSTSDEADLSFTKLEKGLKQRLSEIDLRQEQYLLL